MGAYYPVDAVESRKRVCLWNSQGELFSRSLLAAAGGEKLLQKPGCRALGEPTIDIGRMVAGLLLEKPGTVIHSTALWVLSAVVEPSDPRKRDRACAHGAGLQSDIEIASDEALAAQPVGRPPNDKHLSVGRRVLQFQDPIAGFGQNLTRGIHNHGPNRHFPAVRGGLCLLQGEVHGRVRLSISGHGGTLPPQRLSRQAFQSAQRVLCTLMTDETSSASKTPQGDRIAKVLARAGVCSRRDAERMIEAGRISVNGVVLTSPALNVTNKDKILVDGKPLPSKEPTRLWRYHKERGKVTTARDPEGRPTVFDALPKDLPRVISIGRLDVNTEGLLLLTNDGELARKLELPSTGWARRYRVRAHGRTDQAKLDALQKGIEVDGIRYGPIQARLEREQGANVWISMTLREGKNREIKRVLEKLGLDVNRLIRTSYGPFQLGDLKEGVVQEVPNRILMDQLGETDRQRNADKSENTPKKKSSKRSSGKGAPSKKRTGRKPHKNGPTNSAKKTKSKSGKHADRRR